MKTFEQFNENDPYGEENWNDLSYKEGDILMAVDDIHSGQANQLGHEVILYKKGKPYKIKQIISIMLKKQIFIESEIGEDLPFAIDKVSNYFYKKE